VDRVLWRVMLYGVGHGQLHVEHQVPHRTLPAPLEALLEAVGNRPAVHGPRTTSRKSGIQIACGSTGW
jgi:hypothetical protein